MISRVARVLAASAVVAGGAAALADAAGAPPPPKVAGGGTATLVASGLQTPTSFAFGGGQVFEGDGGSSSSKGPPNGGVFVLKGGKGVRLAATPQFVAGLVWHAGTLYVSGGTLTGPTTAKWQILAWSGWNGTKFTKQSVVWTAPAKLNGLNGLGYAAGHLYVGVDVGLTDNNDHGPATLTPDLYDIMTMTPTGGNVSVFASGMRQPWQMVFPNGSSSPLVSDLGQDKGAKNPPDFVLRVSKGDNFGFPKCNQTVASACAGFTKPFKMFTPHTDIMGLAIIGKTLYMTSFIGDAGKAGEVLSMPLSGGAVSKVVTGFVAPVVGLGVHGGSLYVGELTGQVFKVTP